jgi:hypothetical protein
MNDGQQQILMPLVRLHCCILNARWNLNFHLHVSRTFARPDPRSRALLPEDVVPENLAVASTAAASLISIVQSLPSNHLSCSWYVVFFMTMSPWLENSCLLRQDIQPVPCVRLLYIIPRSFGIPPSPVWREVYGGNVRSYRIHCGWVLCAQPLNIGQAFNSLSYFLLSNSTDGTSSVEGQDARR